MNDIELIDAVFDGTALPDRHFLAALHQRPQLGPKRLLPYLDVERAIVFATFLHSGQYLPGTKAFFISHPLSVGELVATYGSKKPHVWAAAILHDTIAEANYSLDGMCEQFGAPIAAIVSCITEDMSLKSDENSSFQLQQWQERKSLFIEQIQRAPEDSLIVCAADTLDNLKIIERHYLNVSQTVWDHSCAPLDKVIEHYALITKVITSKLKSPITLKLSEYLERVHSLFKEKV